AMIAIMLMRPRGLWPTPEHGRSAPGDSATAGPMASAGSTGTGGRA
ncbi:MAG: ABC transporter ATP-binding protein, partial [Betaproteobacteria bacterium]